MDQIGSFLVFNFFIHPFTSYLCAQPRAKSHEPHLTTEEVKWNKRLGAFKAIVFLCLVAAAQIAYDNHYEKAPNPYEILGVSRLSNIVDIKKAFRVLSKEYHPDKGGNEDAFRRISEAYTILSNRNLKAFYDKFGESGLRRALQDGTSHTDPKHVVIGICLYYARTLVFAFILTLPEPSRDALSCFAAAIAVSLFLEWVLIVLNWEIPAKWLPMYTTAQIVDILHLLLPICLHGCRCILNAFYVNTDENKIAFVKRRVAESIGQREAFRRLNRWALNTLPLGEGEGVATEAKDVSSSSGNSANDHHNDNDRSDDVGHSTQSDDGKGRMAAANTDSEKWRNEMAVYRAGVVRGKWWQLQEAVFREKVASASPCVASDRSDRSESITQLQLQEHVDLEKRLSAVAKGSRLRVLPVTRLTFSSRWSWLLQISLYVATCYIFKR